MSFLAGMLCGCSAACLILAVFMSGAAQGALLFAAIALVNVGLLIMAVRS